MVNAHSPSMRIAGLLFFAAIATNPALVATADPPRPVVKVVEGGESQLKPEDVLTTVLGPGVNQPDPYPGYGGFVGWVSPIRLRNGDWVLGFSAGYWHASAPTPLRFSPGTIAEYQKMGLPTDIVAPTGGVAMIMRSSDEGKTWSRPQVMLDTPDDDRHPAFVELHGPDGMLICSVFTYPGAEHAEYVRDPKLAHRTAIIRSFDYGKTWDKEVIRLPSPFLSDETNGPMVLLEDGSILLTVSGTPKEGGPAQAAFFTSQDRGATWKLLSTLKADHNLDEANATQLPDGRLVMMARPEGDISWSSDEGKTWTTPATFGMRLFAPSLYTLRDGTLVSLHGSYTRGGLRIIFSTDGGQTWIAPAKEHGFLVDNCYAYGKAFELPDGTLLIADQGTGGHTTADAKSMSLRLLRVRIRPDHSGIDLLPVTQTTAASWKMHKVRRLAGGATEQHVPARLQIVTEDWNRVVAVPYIVYMPEKDRLLMLVSCDYPHRPMVLTSDDHGANWSKPQPVLPDEPAHAGHMLGVSLTYLGDGQVLCADDGKLRCRSIDYGQTWSSEPIPPNSHVQWDPYLVDRDAATGKVIQLMETGYRGSTAGGQKAFLRSSLDLGKSWNDATHVPQWAKVSEVALARAANGHIVAACRTDIPPSKQGEALDHFEGLGVSVSADEGQTWSEVQKLFDWGRHHPSLVVMPTGEIVMTYVVRKGYIDTADGFPQFGIEAVVSRDHGKSWDLDHRYLLHTWVGNRKGSSQSPPGPQAWWASSQATSTVLLPDGNLLTAFGTGYRSQPNAQGMPSPRDVGLIQWQLSKEPTVSNSQIRDAAADSDLRNWLDPITGSPISTLEKK